MFRDRVLLLIPGILLGDTERVLGAFPFLDWPNGWARGAKVLEVVDSLSFIRLLGMECEELAEGRMAGVTTPVFVGAYELLGVVARGGTEPARPPLRCALFSGAVALAVSINSCKMLSP